VPELVKQRLKELDSDVCREIGEAIIQQAELEQA